METTSTRSKPVIYEYDNFRYYLKDLYFFFKSNKSAFSYRYFSKRAGFSSPNFLKLVIENKRNLSENSIERFSLALKLSKLECEFFFNLVHFNQSESESEKSHWAHQLLRCKAFQKIHPLKQAEYSYYANWYSIPIREMINLDQFKEDYNWIAEQFSPPLSPEQVKLTLKQLEDLKMITRNSSGQLVQTHKSMTTGNEVSSNFIKQYHKQMISMASSSIDAVPRELREISSVCIPISIEKRDQIKKLIQEFRREVMAIAENDAQTSLVYQLNLQWFPIIENK